MNSFIRDFFKGFFVGAIIIAVFNSIYYAGELAVMVITRAKKIETRVDEE